MSKVKKFVPSEQFLRDNGVKFPEIVFKKYGNDSRMCYENYNTVEDFQKLIDYLKWTYLEIIENGLGRLVLAIQRRLKEKKSLIKYPRKTRDLKNATNEELIKLSEPYKNMSRHELNNLDGGLFIELSSRGLIDSLFPRRREDYKDYSNEELIDLANSLGRSHIGSGLRRNLEDRDIIESVERKYQDHSDEFPKSKEDISKLIKKYKIQNTTDLHDNHAWIGGWIDTLHFSVSDFTDDFLNPYKSSLNLRTDKFLSENKIPYEKEVPIRVKGGRTLKLDFVIKAGNRLIALEPGGSQHIVKCKRFHKTEEAFKDSYIRDVSKFNYCKENQIIIRYWFDFGLKKKDIELATKFLKENNYMNGEAIYFLDEEKFHQEILDLYNYYSNLKNDDQNSFSDADEPSFIYLR